ncbi:MAG: hypothetical protein GYA17_03885 [Chloroflexi bacterium]|nr:hypothetical protein [Chloroflexota bacterium]
MEENFVPRRTVTGLLLITIGLALAALTTTASMPTALSDASMEELINSATSSVWLSILGCLSPISLVLDGVGLFLIASEAKQHSRQHQRLAWIGAILFVVSLVVSLGVSIPLAFTMASQGSRSTALLISWTQSITSVASLAGLVMVVYHLAGRGLRTLILAVAGLQAVTTLGAAAVSYSRLEVVSITIMNQTQYMSQPYRGGLFPPLTIAALITSWLLAVLIFELMMQARQQARQADLDRVV